MPEFIREGIYTPIEIASALGGNVQAVLPESGGRVVACRYQLKRNPFMPGRMYIGRGPNKRRAALWLASTGDFIPFFEKEATNRWRYQGKYRVVRHTEDRETLLKETQDPNYTIGLYFESEDEARERETKFSRRPPAAARQADVEVRAAVEAAAVRVVMRHFEDCEIVDRQKDCVGWDLEARRDGEPKPLLLEVKGLSGVDVRVELTANEYAQMQANAPVYRVCVVTNALADNPQLQILRYNPGTRCMTSQTDEEFFGDEATTARIWQGP